MSRPTQEQIDDVLNRAAVVHDEGTRWPGMSYEEGVENALRWMLGEGGDPMNDDE